jgi:hypothetical protein
LDEKRNEDISEEMEIFFLNLNDKIQEDRNQWLLNTRQIQQHRLPNEGCEYR